MVKKERLKNPFQQIMARKRRAKYREKYHYLQKKLRRLSTVMAIAFLVLLYISLPISKTEAVYINGNHTLSKEKIMAISNAKKGNYFFTNIPFLAKYRLEKNIFIDKANVHWQANRIINIEIEEKKKIAYYYKNNDIYILFMDGTSTKLSKEDYNILNYIPLLSGFETFDQQRMLSSSLKNVSINRIDDISEIMQYSLPYDPEGIKFVMRNGGIMIASYASAYLVQEYNSIYHQTKNKQLCIYATEKNNTAYASVCPWQKQIHNIKWWLDKDGKWLINKSGDYVIEHYYTDAHGKQALDEKGKVIKMPVNEHGYEIPDRDFLKNYEAGYYKNGILNKK